MLPGTKPRWLDLIPDQIWAPFWEGSLLLIVGGCAWAVGQPWLFTSLGPTAYELAEKPELPSARVYNVLVGHYVALGAGFFSLWLIGAWGAPHIVGAGAMPASRLWASVIAAVIATVVNLALRSGQPAALATALLVTSGAYQNSRGAVSILIGVAMLAVIGEPVRRLRLNSKRHREDVRKQAQGPSQLAA